MAWLMMNLYVYSVGLQQFGEGEQQRWTVEPKVISLSQSVFRGTLVCSVNGKEECHEKIG